MIRIGIVGSDNSHADRFSEICNLVGDPKVKGKTVRGARVTHLFGIPEHAERTKEVSTNNKIEHVVGRPEDMIGEIDAAMVVFRHGGLHYKFAKPFIEAGIPTFVDKPFTCSLKDARAIIELAKKKRTPITSYSTYRTSSNTAKFGADLANIAPVTAGTITGPCDIKSEYGGVYFYGIHVVELMLTVFGSGVKSISAAENAGNVIATVKYKRDKIIGLNLLGKASYVFHLTAFGKNGWREFRPQGDKLYTEGLKVFLQMVKTGKKPLTYAQMLESIQVLAAIDRSLKNKGREILLADLK